MSFWYALMIASSVLWLPALILLVTWLATRHWITTTLFVASLIVGLAFLIQWYYSLPSA